MIIQAPIDINAGAKAKIPKLKTIGKGVKYLKTTKEPTMQYDLADLMEYYLTLEDVRRLLKIQNDCK